MAEREVEIVNRLGLHARAAAKLVRVAGGYDSMVTLKVGRETADGKSILGVLMLAAAQGTRLTVQCDGDDEERALAALVELIDAGFEEEAG